MLSVKLTNPFLTGDLDEDYTHVQIISLEQNNIGKTLRCLLAYGYFDKEGDFIPGEGVTTMFKRRYEFSEDDYKALMVDAQTTSVDTSVGDEFYKAIYQLIIASGDLRGTIE